MPTQTWRPWWETIFFLIEHLQITHKFQMDTSNMIICLIQYSCLARLEIIAIYLCTTYINKVFTYLHDIIPWIDCFWEAMTFLILLWAGSSLKQKNENYIFCQIIGNFHNTSSPPGGEVLPRVNSHPSVHPKGWALSSLYVGRKMDGGGRWSSFLGAKFSPVYSGQSSRLGVNFYPVGQIS
jgi:hypothetical protein